MHYNSIKGNLEARGPPHMSFVVEEIKHVTVQAHDRPEP